MEHDPGNSSKPDPTESEILEAMERDITGEPKFTPTQIGFLNSLNSRRAQGVPMSEDNLAFTRLYAQLLGLA